MKSEEIPDWVIWLAVMFIEIDNKLFRLDEEDFSYLECNQPGKIQYIIHKEHTNNIKILPKNDRIQQTN